MGAGLVYEASNVTPLDIPNGNDIQIPFLVVTVCSYWLIRGVFFFYFFAIRFGVRPLPKRQMVLKLKEIHQYTHQIAGSESEDEAPSRSLPSAAAATTSAGLLRPGPGSCANAKAVTFKQPSVSHDVNGHCEEDAEPLSASQGSNTSSTAASEDSER